VILETILLNRGRVNMRVKLIGVVVMVGILATAAHAQKVVRLYSGELPGSENWKNGEKEYFSPIWNTQVVTNVSQPTLTVFAPALAVANGTAVVICPGGGFFALSINSEGVDVAKWLTARGVTAFVLRYRLVPTGDDGVKELMTRITDRQKMEEAGVLYLQLKPLLISQPRFQSSPPQLPGEFTTRFGSFPLASRYSARFSPMPAQRISMLGLSPATR
jgi:hypothetical protein